MMAVSCLAVLLLAWRSAAIEVAGGLLVDLRAGDLEGFAEGAYVTSWVNRGTLGGSLVPAVGPGPARSGSGGAAAAVFDGTQGSVMTGMPVGVTGKMPWTAEAWVFKGSFTGGDETVLTWTRRTGVTGGLVELRYSGNNQTAIEHYHGNVGWNQRQPGLGEWRHIVVTGGGGGLERVYVDGCLVSEAECPNTDLLGNGVLTLGGAQQEGRSDYAWLFKGAVSRLRIHSGVLGPGGVAANFLEEQGFYGKSGAFLAADGAWENPASWAGGRVGAADVETAVSGPTAALTHDAGTLGRFSPVRGGLVMDGGAALATAGQAAVMGYGSGNIFKAAVSNGTLSVRGAGNEHLILGQQGGRGELVVGGGSAAAVSVDRDIIAGQNGGTGLLTLLDGAAVRLATGWLVLGDAGQGAAVVNGGSLTHPDGTALDVAVGRNGGSGALTVNGGLIAPSGGFRWAVGNASPASTNTVRLSGGAAQAERFQADSQAAQNLLYLDGGTVRNRRTHAQFISGLTAARVGAGGAVFDILPGTEATVPQALLTDPALTVPDGGLVKRGPGRLVLSGANTFGGDILVEEGAVCFADTPGNIPAGYAGVLILSGPDAAAASYRPGGVAELLALIPADAVGRILLTPGNASEDIDFSGRPGLSLGALGNVTYTGTLTPYGGNYVFTPGTEAVVYGQAITGAAGVTVTGRDSGRVELSGDNSHSGGTTVRGGTLVVAHTNALGTGPVTLLEGGTLVFAVRMPDGLEQRVTPGSQGFICIRAADAARDIDLSGLPGVHLGTDSGTLEYTGMLAPAGGTFRLGGGATPYLRSGNRGLSVRSLPDGQSPRSLVVQGPGLVHVRPDAALVTYSGGTVVSNGAALFVNGDASLGAVPPAPRAADILVDGGALRLAENATLHANRGVTAGPLGMELHTWGNTASSIRGNLSGTGTVSSTDDGAAYFDGADNTGFTGALDIRRGTLGAGDAGGALSWNKAVPVTGTRDGSFGVSIAGPLAWSAAFGGPLGGGDTPLGLVKTGQGTLTTDTAQGYSGNTRIQGGTLKVAAQGAIPHGPGRGNVIISANAALDVNGHGIAINGLEDAGAVTDGTGLATFIEAGHNNASTRFRGTVSPGLTLVKAGSGTLTLEGAAALMGPVQVTAGAVAAAVPLAPFKGPVALSGTGALSLSGSAEQAYGQGLVGYYYDVPMPSDNNDTRAMFDSLAKILATAGARAPSAVSSSARAGAGFDFGQGGEGFPAPYSNRQNFMATWRGRFIAGAAGAYTFGTQSDDGSAIYVNGGLVVDNVHVQGFNATPRTGTVALEAGLHDILVFFFQKGGGLGMRAWVAEPGGALAVLPNSLLVPDPVNTPVQDLSGGAGTHVNLLNGAGIDLVTAEDSAFLGTLAPASSLVKRGPARQALATAAPLSSAFTSVREGTLAVDATGSLGDLEVSPAAALAVGGAGLLTVSGLGLADGTVALEQDWVALEVDDVQDGTFSGTLTGGTTTAVIKTGPATLTVAGDTSGFLGTWHVLGGILEVAGGALPGGPGSRVFVAPGAALSLTGPGAAAYAREGVSGAGIVLVNGASHTGQSGEGVWLAPGQGAGGAFGIYGGAVIACTGAGLDGFTSSGGILALAVTNTGQAFAVGQVALEAPGGLGVTVGGLFGRYHDLKGAAAHKPSALVLSAFSNSVQSIEAFLADPAHSERQLASSSWAFGDALDAGEDGSGHPGKYAAHNRSHFAVHWKGEVCIPLAGTYTFATRSDDASVLFIGGRRVVDNNRFQGMTTRSGDIDLEAGRHAIDIFYYQADGGHGMRVYVKAPGEAALSPLPNAMLLAHPDDTAGLAYTLDVGTLDISGQGAAAVSFLQGDGTLGLADLTVDPGTLLAAGGGRVRVTGTELGAGLRGTLPPGAAVPVADLSATPGLPLTGVLLRPPAANPGAKLGYRGKVLFLSTEDGPLTIIR